MTHSKIRLKILNALVTFEITTFAFNSFFLKAILRHTQFYSLRMRGRKKPTKTGQLAKF